VYQKLGWLGRKRATQRRTMPKIRKSVNLTEEENETRFGEDPSGEELTRQRSSEGREKVINAEGKSL